DAVFITCFAKEGEKPSAALLLKSDGGQELDKLLEGQISKTIQERLFAGKEGEILSLPTFGKIKAKTVVVIGAGLQKNFSLDSLRRMGAKLVQTANALKVKNVAGQLEATRIKNHAPQERLQAFTEGAVLGDYNFTTFKKKEVPPAKTLKTFRISAKGNKTPLQKAIAQGEIVATAANLTRELVNTPPGHMTPTDLAKAAQEVAKKYKNIRCKVFGVNEIKKEKMGAILAVSQGSDEPPSFVHLSYKPAKKSKTKVALVGKGITFDSGGLNIKTREMEFMKMDMAGAATVIGVFQAIAQLKPNIEVEGFIAAAENLLSGSAIKPSDIITTRAGRTVEIINTDAEGRLVLADALDYACDQNPTYIIDMATLTGGAAYAVGEIITPILGNDKTLVDKILAAGKAVGEPVWELPIVKEYKKGYLKGPADLKNSGSGSKASTICGALFLEDFARKNKWVHMDIASTAWADEPMKYYAEVGATGNPVRTIINFLLSF
ncbi:MAG: leucyl aminopeptidase, partial [bacterium]|nr:leucyl aminopeptidase [bacterium]